MTRVVLHLQLKSSYYYLNCFFLGNKVEPAEEKDDMHRCEYQIVHRNLNDEVTKLSMPLEIMQSAA